MKRCITKTFVLLTHPRSSCMRPHLRHWQSHLKRDFELTWSKEKIDGFRRCRFPKINQRGWNGDTSSNPVSFWPTGLGNLNLELLRQFKAHPMIANWAKGRHSVPPHLQGEGTISSQIFTTTHTHAKCIRILSPHPQMFTVKPPGMHEFSRLHQQSTLRLEQDAWKAIGIRTTSSC